MSYKTLLALHPVHDLVSRLDPVTSLAHAFEAHVDALVMNVLAPIPTMPFAQGDAFDLSDSFSGVMRDTHEREKHVRAYFEENDVRATVDSEAAMLGMLDTAVARAALYTDLVVVGGGSSLVGVGMMTRALEGALFKAGRPVLVIGTADERAPVEPDLVMIAWDGGREAARAVQQSLPLLARAASVRVLIVDEGDTRELEHDAKRLDLYLTRHGIDSELDRVAPAGRFVAHAIVEHVIDSRPDLLVMGAYGHTRIRERLFSGVTRAALTDLETSLFLAH